MEQKMNWLHIKYKIAWSMIKLSPKLNRSTLLDPAVPVYWCGQPPETMATSGHTLMSSCPTRHLSEWASKRRWVETCGPTSRWMTSPTPQSVWLEVKTLKFFPSVVFPVFPGPSPSCHLLLFPIFFFFHISCRPTFSSPRFPYELCGHSGRE